MHTIRRTLAAAVAGAALTASLAGCGKSVEAENVEQELQSAVKAKMPDAKLEKPKCEDDLPAEKGKTVDCAITIDGKPSKFTAKVTSIEDDKVQFDLVPKK